jgi:hypothetical protein
MSIFIELIYESLYLIRERNVTFDVHTKIMFFWNFKKY